MITEKIPIRLEHLADKLEETVYSLTLGVYEEYRKEVNDILIRYLTKSVKLLRDIKSEKCIEEFHDACKRRSEEFIKIISRILHKYDRDCDSELLVIDRDGAFTKLIINGELVFEYKEFYPRSHRVLINGLSILNDVNDERQVRIILRAFCSACHWYKDMRWTSKNKIYALEEEAFNRIFDGKPIADEEYINSSFRRRAFRLDLSKRPDWHEFPCLQKMLMNMHRAISRLPRSLDNMETPYYISLKSSGMYDKINRRTVPALFASQYEIDKLDESFNFTNIITEGLYGTMDCPDNQFDGRFIGKTISIPQKKLERRIIHISPNFIQDRLMPYHIIAARILRNNPNDCTFDQKKGFLRSKDWTGTLFEDNAILSLDLSKATDTWDINHQVDVLYNIIKHRCKDPVHAVKTWRRLMRYPTLAHKQIRSMKYGQPQGRISSFPVFALAHHFIMLLTFSELAYAGKLSEDDIYDYVILGDDSCVTIPKRLAQEFKERYIRNMKSVNVECNPDKGYTSIDGPRLSEFAKVLCVDGHYMTPTPWNLLSQSNKSWEDKFKLAVWYLTYSNDIDPEVICSQIPRDDIEPSQLLSLVTAIVDIQNEDARFLDIYYDKEQYHKIQYFYDLWYLKDSILLSLLDSNSVEYVHESYSTDRFEDAFKRQLKTYSIYYNNLNRKLVDLFDDFTIREIIIDKLNLDITLSSEECEIARVLFSTLRSRDCDLELIFNQALDILGDISNDIPESYVRNKSFQSITNALRQRSFITEFHCIRNDKLYELSLWLKDLSVDDSTEESYDLLEDFLNIEI